MCVVSFLLVPLVALATPPAPAGPSIDYVLTKEAAYTEGCYPPCACPIWFAELAGTFRLTPLTSRPGFDVWSVDDVDWTIGPVGGGHVTGGGTLTIMSEFVTVQRLDLELSIDGSAPARFTGERVGESAPTIDVTISQNGMICFDRVFDVNALPATAACPEDLDGDGQVLFDDLLQLLSMWGPCGICVEDIDRDGVAGFADLLRILAAWGTCS